MFSATGAKTSEGVAGWYSADDLEQVSLAQLDNGNLVVSVINNAQGSSSSILNRVEVFSSTGAAVSGATVSSVTSRPTNSSWPDTTNVLIALQGGTFAQLTDATGTLTWSGAGGSPGHGQETLMTTYALTGGSVSKSSSSGSAPLFGSSSSDTLSASGVYQVVEAGAGNDTILASSGLLDSLALGGSINGDTGTDTLVVNASSYTLNLTQPATARAINGIEVIDLGSNAGNTVVMHVSEALRLASGEAQNRVFIDGDSTSTVKLSAQYSNGAVSGSWSQAASNETVNGVSYKVYTYSGEANLKVMVESSITSIVTDYVMNSADIVAGGGAGTLTVGDFEDLKNASSNHQSVDTTPLISGSIPALPAGATLSLTRTDVTGGGAPVNLGVLTLNGSNQWSYQETTALSSGKRYKYVAVLTLSDGSTVASNDYSIDIVAAGSSSATTPTTPTPSALTNNPPTLVITDSEAGIAKAVTGRATTVRHYFTFDEAVTGFEAADIVAKVGYSSATVSNFTKVSDTQYFADVAVAADSTGSLVVAVRSGAYTDASNVGGVGAANVQHITSSGGPVESTGGTGVTAGITGRAIELLDGSIVYLSGNTNQNSFLVLDSTGALKGTGGLSTPTLNGTIHKADVTALRDGGFAVLSGGQLQTFNADGTTKTTAVSYTTGAAANSGIDAVQLSDGKFMLFYYNTSNSFCYKVINADGSDAVGETQMGPTGMADSSDTIKGVMDAVVLSDGRVAVAFAGKTLGGYQFFSATGTPIGEEQTYMVEGTTRDMQAVATQDGGYLVASTENKLTYGFLSGSPTSYYVNITKMYKVDADMTRSNPKIVEAYQVNGPSAPTLSGEVGLAVYNDGTIAVASTYDSIGTGSTFVRTFNPDFSGRETLDYRNGALSSNTSAVAALDNGSRVVFLNNPSDSTKTLYYVYDSQLGSSTINGNTSAEILVGGEGADVIKAGGGADNVYAGNGNDTVIVNSSNLTQLLTSTPDTWIDGGAGSNTFRLDGTSLTLDLTHATLGPRVTNFSNFDISGSGANILTLNVSDVLASNTTLGTKAHVVRIDGDSDDTVNLRNLLDGSSTASGTWSTSSTATIGNTTYNLYSLSNDPSVQVLIDNQITQVTLS